MTKQMLYVHWKAVRLGLLPFVLAAFGLPLVVANGLANSGPAIPTVSTSVALSGVEEWMPLFPILAASIGCLLALSAWNWDHKANHAYALSLPISRQRYAMMKFGAGCALAAIPVFALLLGSGVAMLAVDVPASLNVYPLQLAARFFFGITIVYAILFSLASGTIRTTVIVLSIFIGVPMLLSTGVFRPLLSDLPVSYWISQALRHGPFRVLFGNWMLFDV
jgi:hypothetical protein